MFEGLWVVAAEVAVTAGSVVEHFNVIEDIRTSSTGNANYHYALLLHGLSDRVNRDDIPMKWFTEFGHLYCSEVICSPQNSTGASMKKRNFSAEFKREFAQLVLDQNYTVAAAASAMDVGLSTMTRWVKQFRDERQGKIPKASPITPEQIEIRELKKKIQRIEMENDILKKATALLMLDSLNNSR